MVDLNRLYTMGTRSKEIFIIQLLRWVLSAIDHLWQSWWDGDSFAVSKLPQIGHCPDALESHQSFFQCTVVSYSKSILIAARCQLVRRLVMISPDAVFDLVPLEIENTSVQRPVSSMDGRPLQCWLLHCSISSSPSMQDFAQGLKKDLVANF